MTRLIASLAFALALVATSTPAFAQKTGGVRVEFQGPGGHSFGAYGRVSAVHAAALYGPPEVRPAATEYVVASPTGLQRIVATRLPGTAVTPEGARGIVEAATRNPLLGSAQTPLPDAFNV